MLYILALLACTDETDPTAITPGTVVPSGEPTAVPTPTPDPVECDDPMVPLLAADLPAANAAYQACLASTPDDPALKYGEAITSLFLLYDDPALTGLVRSCGEDPVDAATLYGPNGLLAEWEEASAGTVDLTTVELVGDGPYDLFPDGPPTYVTAWNSDYSASVNAADDARYKRSLSIQLDREYYDDHTNGYATVQVGDVVSLGAGGAYPYASGFCEGRRCSWSIDTEDGLSSGTGTITLVRADANQGTVQLDFDVTLPEYRGGPSLHLVGSVVDTPFDEASILDDFDQLDAFDTSRCDTESCDDDTEAFTRIAEVCPDVSQNVVWTRGREVRSRLMAVAERLEEAAVDPAVQFVFPADALPFLFADLSFNQADAWLIAAQLRASAASLSMASSYDLIDPTITGAARLGHYTQGFWEYDPVTDTDSCVDNDVWGIDPRTLMGEVDTHLGTLRADEELSIAREQLRLSMVDLQAALNASASAGGFADPGGDVGTRDQVLADVAVVLASLSGTDGALASVPAYQVTLDAWFASPLTQAAVATGIGEDPMVIDDTSCQPYLEGSEEIATWLPQNNGAFPVTEDLLDTHGAPGWITAYEDYDVYDDGLPGFAGSTPAALEAAYGDAYYDSP